MNRKLSIFVIPVLIVFFLLSASHAEIYIVKRVIDGDTLLLLNGERVRLIGVDTPETKHPQKPVEYFGREAYLFTRQMVDGKEARLEFERQRRDRYGRLLAYVYLLDGTFLNAEIIKQGYGFAYTRFPFKHMEEFRRYEREARENRKGMWKGSDRYVPLEP
jgi:micrococcal nuclease